MYDLLGGQHEPAPRAQNNVGLGGLERVQLTLLFEATFP
jgi:hypothetical protein